MSFKIRLLSLFSEMLDLIIILAFLVSLIIVGKEPLLFINENVIYVSKTYLSVLYLIFIFIYFGLYPARHKGATFSKKVLSLKFENYKNKDLIKTIFSNIVFWVTLMIIYINVVEIENIDFHSSTLILFGLVLYAIFILLHVDLVAIFGLNLKIDKE